MLSKSYCRWFLHTYFLSIVKSSVRLIMLTICFKTWLAICLIDLVKYLKYSGFLCSILLIFTTITKYINIIKYYKLKEIKDYIPLVLRPLSNR